MLVILTTANIDYIQELTLFPRWSRSIWITAWEQRKFSELASLRRELTYSPTDIRPYGQGVRVLRSSNIAEDEFVLSREDVFVDEDVVKIDLTQDDEILITAANGSPRLVGKRAKIHDLAGKTVHGGFMLCARAEQPDFVVALMGSQWYQRFLVTGVAGGNGSIGNLDKEALENETALIPRTEEQRLIGAYFSRLDALITLHQRKCQYRGLYGYLSWEQRKLGEIARRVTRKNDGNESDLPLTISAQYGLVDQRTFFNNQVASKDMSGYYLLKEGEFAYNKSTSTDSPWGAIKRLLNYDKGCVSTLYICFDLIDADPDFLVTYYETNRWYKSVQLIAAEGARNHELLNIAPNDFFDTVLSIPGEQQEQKLIGNYFSNLDNLITLHQ